MSIKNKNTYYDKTKYNEKFEEYYNFFELIKNKKISYINEKPLRTFLEQENLYDDNLELDYGFLIFEMKSIIFAYNFNESLDNIVFPETIEDIDLGGFYNHPINNIKFPKKLKRLNLGLNYDLPLDDIIFPQKLLLLDLGHNFNHPIEHIKLPNTLIELRFSVYFNHPIEKLKIPLSLKKIKVNAKFNYPLTNLEINDNTELYFYHTNPIPINNLPKNLKNLTIEVLTEPLFNLPILLENINIIYDKGELFNENGTPFIELSKIPYFTKII